MHPAGVCPKLPFHQGSSSQHLTAGLCFRELAWPKHGLSFLSVAGCGHWERRRWLSYSRKDRQTVNCHSVCSSQVHSDWVFFLEEKTQALSLKPWQDWLAGTIWCRLSQPEVQGTSPCICRRKYKVFQQQIRLGNTGVLLVQDVWLSKIIILYCESPKRGI